MAGPSGAIRAGQAWARRFTVRFRDFGGWTWVLYLSPQVLQKLEAAAIDLKRLTHCPGELTEFLRHRGNCIKFAAVALADQAEERGLDRNGFLDRMIDQMRTPNGPARLTFSIVAAIVKTFTGSPFGREYRSVPEMLEKEGR